MDAYGITDRPLFAKQNSIYTWGYQLVYLAMHGSVMKTAPVPILTKVYLYSRIYALANGTSQKHQSLSGIYRVTEIQTTHMN